MKCASCEIEINPQWRHAIDANVCPFCGSAILEEHLKNLLSTISDVMEDLLAYQDQLNDWMLSNHSYIKTNSPDLIYHIPQEMLQVSQKDVDFQKRKEAQDKKFTVKVQTEMGEEEVVVEKVQSEDKTNDFFKRAEAVKPNIEGYKNTMEKTEHLKRVVQQIKKGGSVSLVNEGGSGIMIDPSMMDNADEEAIAELRCGCTTLPFAAMIPARRRLV